MRRNLSQNIRFSGKGNNVELIEYIHPSTGARRYGVILKRIGKNTIIVKDYATGKKVQITADKLIEKDLAKKT